MARAFEESFFCNICGHTLDREDFRWRCDQHCNWNACRGCYDAHWFGVVRTASREPDKQMQAKLLAAIPVLWRQQNKDGEIAVWRANALQPTDVSERRGTAETGVEQGGNVEGPLPAWVPAAAWLLVAAVATGAAAQAASTLLRADGEKPELPHPWLLLGLSHVGAVLLCAGAACFLGSGTDQTAGGAAAEIGLKEYSILGLMYGVEHGIDAIVLRRETADACAEAYMLTPFFMLLAGVGAAIEKPRMAFLSSIGAVALGGLFMTRLSLDLAGLQNIEHLVLFSNIIATFRWVFTRNVLPAVGVPLISFAMKLLPTAAALGFELAFMTDFSSYPALLSLRDPGRVAGLVLLISLCMAVALVAELHVAHVGLTPLGFLGPLRLFIGLCWAAANNDDVGLTRLLGTVVCIIGIAVYVWQVQHEELARDLPPGMVPHPVTGPDANGYLRVSAGGSVPRPVVGRDANGYVRRSAGGEPMMWPAESRAWTA
eukprot:CAMPEP_0172684462 /NCGR_PEP_ID=MMETSP1074-20121228/19575_1 /TAXON_ID=2916 /ORGANISM="Ceratium fusus, Strain PA161109" /LENGTH=485 /DNA_ID=CAMNT_0013503479 /DNA_START=184 /DNA_END=1642 /DNA_ORIENTATION=-